APDLGHRITAAFRVRSPITPRLRSFSLVASIFHAPTPNGTRKRYRTTKDAIRAPRTYPSKTRRARRNAKTSRIIAVPHALKRPRYRYTPVARAPKPKIAQRLAITRARVRTTLTNSVPATTKRTRAHAARAMRTLGSRTGASSVRVPGSPFGAASARAVFPATG